MYFPKRTIFHILNSMYLRVVNQTGVVLQSFFECRPHQLFPCSAITSLVKVCDGILATLYVVVHCACGVVCLTHSAFHSRYTYVACAILFQNLWPVIK